MGDVTRFLKASRIGYFPNTTTLSAPGDRRRFCFYASERGFDFELADENHEYDVVYLTSGCNISAWLDYKKRTPQSKLIFELINSYLLDDHFSVYFRGVARYLQRRENKFYLDYRDAFRRIVGVADAVVCSTPLQKTDLLKYNNNVHISLDYFTSEIKFRKAPGERLPKIKIAWEGQSYTLKNLQLLRPVFDDFPDELELHIITDDVIKYPFGIFDRKAEKIINDYRCHTHFQRWEQHTFNENITNCDLVVIPIIAENALSWHKPENKLLMMWEMGMPVLASPTPAYKRVMATAGLDLLCATEEQWKRKILRVKHSSARQLSEYTDRANTYLLTHHTKDHLLNSWDQIIKSVLP